MKTKEDWISSKERLPDFNRSVLVFIPEEDNHITVGMWDVSLKWVLLDEYRIPKSEVTYWTECPPEPVDKSYTPSKHHPDEMDTITYQIRELNKQVFESSASNRELESRNKELEQALMSVLWMWQIANKSHYDRNTDAVNKFKALLSKPGSTELNSPDN
jgi:hypothetical protein